MKRILKSVLRNTEPDDAQAKELGLIDKKGDPTEFGELFITSINLDLEIKKAVTMSQEIVKHYEEADEAVFMYTVGSYCGLSDKDIDEGLMTGFGRDQLIDVAAQTATSVMDATHILRAAGVNNTEAGNLIKEIIMRFAMERL